MRILFVIFLTALLPACLWAQEHTFSREFTEVGDPEMDMSIYDKDPNAEAVILFDIGVSEFLDETYNIKFVRSKRIKVLKSSGVDYATVRIPFYKDGYGKTEIVRNIEAYTYNKENGEIVKKSLNPKSIYEEKINERWNVKKFAFPDVKVGTVIEYQYELETPFHFNLPDWQFQDVIPTVYSCYTAKMVPFYEYIYIAQGIRNFDYHHSEVSKIKRKYGSVSKSYGQNIGSGFEFFDYVHTYAMEDVPAFKNEGFITSMDDYIMKIDFQLAKFHSPQGGEREIMTTWPELSEGLYKNEHFGKYIKSSQKQAKKLLEEMSLGGLGETAKAATLIEFVRNQFTFNKIFTKYAHQSAKDLVDKRLGSSGEINLFLLSLLEEAGLEAYPVILSTRSHGKISADYPFDHFFNYVVVMVYADGKSFLADAVQNFVPFHRLPIWCINGRGLVLKEMPAWVNLENDMPSYLTVRLNTDLNLNELEANYFVTVQTTDYEAFEYKYNYEDNEEKLTNAFLKDGFKSVKSMASFNYGKNDKPYGISFNATSELGAINAKIILSPFLKFPIQENQLHQKNRTYPIDMVYASLRKYEALIGVPEGYAVMALPENYKLNNELVYIDVNYVNEGEVVKVNASYMFKKSIYQPEEYPKVKEYYDEIVKRFNQQIAFEKQAQLVGVK
ncbi:DUF3857 domain-containing protein [Fulvivirga sediminis]|uniref:DUF3857 domain-containing protein n=1 Tax=Fulvivirga sediminis TaxID=2803949 RepID=A0A937K2C3_9BACT|nr:DUF3857 domain-containing protein [Fulvivirga sediminis]MBL3658436.1 DUF3857 domain-containing protein [Fulvivirga sediminis]